MIGDFVWTIAASGPVLAILGLFLLLCLAIGWLPLIKYIPVIGPEVLPARLAAILVALLIPFLLGVHVADQRQALDRLRATLAARQADLTIASKSAADAQARADQIEKAANDQRKADDDYIASLKVRPACLLDDSDIRALGGLRGRPSFWHRARPTAGTR